MKRTQAQQRELDKFAPIAARHRQLTAAFIKAPDDKVARAAYNRSKVTFFAAEARCEKVGIVHPQLEV